MTTSKTNTTRKALVFLAFIILTFLIYSNTLQSPFFFDDKPNITDNPHIRLTELDTESIITAGLKGRHSHRLISKISFALNYYFHQYDVVGYHLINIIIHILTAIFLYLFVKKTLITPALRDKYSNCSWIAFFAALLWLVHPIQTQSVTYIVQRMNSLASMFYILSLLFYVKGRLNKSWGCFIACFVSGLLALGSKQIAATLPFFILLYEWFFFQDLNRRWLKRVFPYIAGVVILICLLGLLYLGTNPFDKILSGYTRRDFNLTERLLTQPRVIINYITLLFAPHPGRLNLDHYVEVSHSLTSPVMTLPAIGTIFGLIILAVYFAKKNRLVSFCILWFLGNLLIESSVLALELMFEHRLYLPSMFVSLAIVALVYRLIKPNWIKVTVFCIVAALFCSWTYERNKVWADEFTLWKDCVEKSPKKPRPHNNFALQLQSLGQTDEAIEHYRQALKLKPDFAEVHNNLGLALKSQDKLADAVSHYNQALQIRPDYAEAHYNLGLVIQSEGKLDEAIDHYRQALKLMPDNAQIHYDMGVALQLQNKLTEAIKHYRQAVSLRPDYAEAHNNLAIAYQSQGKLAEAISHYSQALQIRPDYAKGHNNLGFALGLAGRADEAMSHYRKAIQLVPDFAEAHYNVGTLFQAQGKIDEAIAQYRRALESKSHYAEAHNSLGTLLAIQGKFNEAIYHYDEALHSKPNWPQPLNDLAWILATRPNASMRGILRAVVLAEQAVELTARKNVIYLDTLAASYAAAGHFGPAVRTAEEALALAAGNDNLASQIRSRLQLYRRHEPYQESIQK